jgi:hypothetical protein
MPDDPMPWDDLEISEEAARAALARIDAAWNDLLAAIDGIPPERLEEPGVTGDWSIRDLMGHIAFWDRFSLSRGRDSLDGRPFQTVPWDDLNEQDIANRAGSSAAENRADMEAAHAEMLAFVSSCPQDPAILLPMLAKMGVDTDQHYDEHTAEIRAWRQREGI